MNFYALKNKTSGRWNTPFLAHSDVEAVDIIAKTVSLQNDLALIYSLDDLILFDVGSFMVEEKLPIVGGVIVPVMENLHENLPLPPFVRKMVDKIYNKDGDVDVE